MIKVVAYNFPWLIPLIQCILRLSEPFLGQKVEKAQIHLRASDFGPRRLSRNILKHNLASRRTRRANLVSK